MHGLAPLDRQQETSAARRPGLRASPDIARPRPVPGRGLKPSRIPARPDPREREADAAAEQVTGAGCLPAAPASAKGSGPLPGELRAALEARFGADFGGVRLHTGARADRVSRESAASAVTAGADVSFREGAYDPGRPAGLRLLAHELAHAVQQGAAPRTGPGPALSAAPRGTAQPQLVPEGEEGVRYTDSRDRQERKRVYTKAFEGEGLTGVYNDSVNGRKYRYDEQTQQFNILRDGTQTDYYWDPETLATFRRVTPGEGDTDLTVQQKPVLHAYTKGTGRYAYNDSHEYRPLPQYAKWVDTLGRYVNGSGSVVDNTGKVQKHYVLGADTKGRYVLPVKLGNLMRGNQPTFAPGLPGLFGGAVDPLDPADTVSTLNREIGEESDFQYQVTPDTNAFVESETAGFDVMHFYTAGLTPTASRDELRTAHIGAHGPITREAQIDRFFQFSPQDLRVTEDAPVTEDTPDDQVLAAILRLFEKEFLTPQGRTLAEDPDLNNATRRKPRGGVFVSSPLEQFRASSSAKFLVKRVKEDLRQNAQERKAEEEAPLEEEEGEQ